MNLKGIKCRVIYSRRHIIVNTCKCLTSRKWGECSITNESKLLLATSIVRWHPHVGIMLIWLKFCSPKVESLRGPFSKTNTGHLQHFLCFKVLYCGEETWYDSSLMLTPPHTNETFNRSLSAWWILRNSERRRICFQSFHSTQNGWMLFRTIVLFKNVMFP